MPEPVFGPNHRIRLHSIEREAEKCRQAFKNSKVGDLVQHCHHAQWLEVLNEPAENRISYILSDKPKAERAMRLRLFRPVTPLLYRTLPDALKKAHADWQKAHADRQKADADWQKAAADWQKADADRQKAHADRQKADADRQKADADRQKAHADHREFCGCQWSKKTDIFGKKRWT